MQSSLVSCIVPVYNGERYLREALDSILAQTYRPIEIIVVDDGSTDGTHEVAASYGDRVRYLCQPNSGPAQARNFGLGAAHGEFVAFLDADDLWDPEKLARQMARFKAHPELDLCVTHLQNFWITELEKERIRFQHHRLAKILPGYVTVTLLARRTLFEKLGPFNTDLKVGDDTEWFLRAAEQGAVMELLPDLLVYRRMHENNLSMEPGTRRQTGSLQDAALHIVKASLDRRRKQSETDLASLKLPASSWRTKT
jgi:glycosyltransferase involved in cell wall biosynthesis